MRKKIYGKILGTLFCINTVGVSQTIWTDMDFPAPKGHTWINSGNPEYGGDVHIKNTNPVKFSSDMSGKPNTGVLGIESGGKLTADGEVIVEQTGTTKGDAVLVTDGGKAYFNGGLTAITKDQNNDYYTVASNKAGSQLHVTGNTNILSEFAKGYGLYLGEGTTNSFNKDSNGNGILNISTGARGIHSIGNTDFNQKVNITLNSNGATGILTLDSSSSSLSNFNDKVYVTNNSISDNTSSAYGIAVNNANGIINLNDGAVINFGETYTNGNEIGLYSGKGILNVKGDLFIKTNSGNLQLALYAVNGGKIDVSDSVVNLKGDISSNNGTITMNTKEGSVWEGSSYVKNSGRTDITMKGTSWNMTNDSTLNDLTLLNDSTLYLNPAPSTDNFTPRELTITGNYLGNNSTIVFNTKLEDDSSLTDRLNIQGDTSGNTKVSVRNAGGNGAQTIEGIELISVGGNSVGEFIKDGRIVAGAYEYFLSRGNGTSTDSNNWYLTSEIPTIIPPIVPPVDSPVDPSIDPPVNPPIVKPPVTGEVNPKPKPTYRPEYGSYLANNIAVNTLFLHTLHDRLGETQFTDSLIDEGKSPSIWVRSVGGNNSFKDSSDQLKTKSRNFILQVGSDVAQWSNDGLNRYHLGIMGGYALSHNNTDSNITNYSSKGEVEGYSIGVYGTWYANERDKSGLYTDSWFMYSKFNNEVNGEGLDKEKYSSDGITASIESGYTFKIAENSSKKNAYFIQPKAQIIYMGVNTNNHTETNGTFIETQGEDNIQTRLGVRAYMNNSNPVNKDSGKEFQPFIEANWIHYKKDFSVLMDGESNKPEGMKDLGEIKLGTEIKINTNLDVWGNIAYQWGKSEYNDSQITVGLKYRF